MKRFYWPVHVTSRANISHFIPLIEIARLLDEGTSVTILIGDLHSRLLNDKTPALDARCDYYKIILRLMLEKLSKKIDNLTIRMGSDLESQADYMLDFYLIAGSTQIDMAVEATTDIIKPSKHPLLGGLVYPVVRAVDDKHVKADGQIASVQEKKIIDFTDKLSDKIKHQPGERLFYSTLLGLSANKVQVINEEDDFIDVLDGPKQVKKKLGRAFCEPGNDKENGVLPILEKIIFPIFKTLEISRPEQYGGDVKYSSYEEIRKDFVEQKLHPGDLKKGVETKINELLDNIQKYFQSSEEFQKLANIAFPVKKDKNPRTLPVNGSISLEPLKLDPAKESLSPEEKSELITRRLQEVLQRDLLETILKTRNLKIYWGTATTGRPHVAYFVPMAKIADFLRADCEVTVLLANLHGYLDSQKAPWDLLDARTEYYERIIVSMLHSIGVSTEKLRFVRGTEYELGPNFSQDVFKLIAQTTLHDAKKAGAEVVKQMSDPLIGSLLYPLLQSLDEEYLGCDAQFGGVDQRKIFTYSEKYLPQIGYQKRIHLMNPMVPGLTGGKMSSSEAESKIDLLDDSETVIRKIDSALCSRDNVSENGILAFIEHVIWPLFNKITVAQLDPVLAPKVYETHESLVADFVSGSLEGSELKSIAATHINKLLDPIRKEFECEKLQQLAKAAYPST